MSGKKKYIASLESQLSKIKESSKKRINDLELQLSNIENGNQYKSQIDSLQKSLKDSDHINAHTNQENSRLEKDNENLKDRISDLEQQQEELGNRNNEQREQIESHQNQLENLKLLYNQLIAEKQQLTADKRSLVAQNQRFREELDAQANRNIGGVHDIPPYQSYAAPNPYYVAFPGQAGIPFLGQAEYYYPHPDSALYQEANLGISHDPEFSSGNDGSSSQLPEDAKRGENG